MEKGRKTLDHFFVLPHFAFFSHYAEPSARLINHVHLFLLTFPTLIFTSLYRVMYPKDLMIGTISLLSTFILFGVAQSHEPRVAQIKRQYPSLVPASVLGLAVLIIYALGSTFVFLWGVTMPLAGR